jgi:hypothetical protein
MPFPEPASSIFYVTTPLLRTVSGESWTVGQHHINKEFIPTFSKPKP